MRLSPFRPVFVVVAVLFALLSHGSGAHAGLTDACSICACVEGTTVVVCGDKIGSDSVLTLKYPPDTTEIQLLKTRIDLLPKGAFLQNDEDRGLRDLSVLRIDGSDSFRGIESLSLALPNEQNWSSIYIGNLPALTTIDPTALGQSMVETLVLESMTKITDLSSTLLSSARQITLLLSSLPLQSNLLTSNFTTDLTIVNSPVATLPPDLFGDCTSIESFSLTGSIIKSIPRELFSRLSNLKNVNLTGNPDLTSLPAGLFYAPGFPDIQRYALQNDWRSQPASTYGSPEDPIPCPRSFWICNGKTSSDLFGCSENCIDCRICSGCGISGTCAVCDSDYKPDGAAGCVDKDLSVTPSSATPSATPSSATPSVTPSSATPSSATPSSATPKSTSATPSSTAPSSTLVAGSSSAIGAEVIAPVAAVSVLLVLLVLLLLAVRMRRTSKQRRRSSAFGMVPLVSESTRTTRTSSMTSFTPNTRDSVEPNKYDNIEAVDSNLGEYISPAREGKTEYQDVLSLQSPQSPAPAETSGAKGESTPEKAVKYTFLFFEKPSEPSESLRTDLNMIKQLGEGQFGQVFLATVNLGAIPEDRRQYFFSHADSLAFQSSDPSPPPAENAPAENAPAENAPAENRINRVPVAVKVLKEAALEKNMESFIAEARTIAAFDHPNIVRVCGILIERTPMMIILEFMPYGDLQSMLQKSVSLSIPWNQLEFIHCLHNIAMAMEYLQSLRFVHRDLAARNCLVGHDFVVKISDFGLSRRIATESDYYKMKQGGLVPVRWLAPESLSFMSFTSASDVWAFGVTAWEIFTYGKPPYGTLPLEELLPSIEKGGRLARPVTCDRSIWDHVKACWKWDPKERPSFKQLASTFGELAIELGDSNELRDVPTLIYGKLTTDNYVAF